MCAWNWRRLVVAWIAAWIVAAATAVSPALSQVQSGVQSNVQSNVQSGAQNGSDYYHRNNSYRTRRPPAYSNCWRTTVTRHARIVWNCQPYPPP